MWTIYEKDQNGRVLRKTHFTKHADAVAFFDNTAIKRCQWCVMKQGGADRIERTTNPEIDK